MWSTISAVFALLAFLAGSLIMVALFALGEPVIEFVGSRGASLSARLHAAVDVKRSPLGGELRLVRRKCIHPINSVTTRTV